MPKGTHYGPKEVVEATGTSKHFLIEEMQGTDIRTNATHSPGSSWERVWVCGGGRGKPPGLPDFWLEQLGESWGSILRCQAENSSNTLQERPGTKN